MTLQAKREFYIPKGAARVAMKDGGAVFYLYRTKAGEPAAVCFVGRAEKPTWRYRFRSDAEREQRVRRQIEVVRQRATDRAERRKRSNRPHTLEKGLILYTSWGYDQTNTEFYEVIDVPSPCYVVLQEIAAPLVRGEESFMSGNRMPDPDARIGEPFRRKVDMTGARPSVRINSVVSAWIWDGKEKSVSWYS